MTFRHILRYVTLMKNLNNLDGSVEVATNVQHVTCKIKLARQYTDHKEVQKKAK